LVVLAALLPDNRRKAIDEEIETEIANAVNFAESSPFPDIKALYSNVYSGQ
jgi:TPP-dependent pyruvate/acetoin dehydrogenase alpha subunit